MQRASNVLWRLLFGLGLPFLSVCLCATNTVGIDVPEGTGGVRGVLPGSVVIRGDGRRKRLDDAHLSHLWSELSVIGNQ